MGSFKGQYKWLLGVDATKPPDFRLSFFLETPCITPSLTWNYIWSSNAMTENWILMIHTMKLALLCACSLRILAYFHSLRWVHRSVHHCSLLPCISSLTKVQDAVRSIPYSMKAFPSTKSSSSSSSTSLSSSLKIRRCKILAKYHVCHHHHQLNQNTYPTILNISYSIDTTNCKTQSDLSSWLVPPSSKKKKKKKKFSSLLRNNFLQKFNNLKFN